ncbi:MAG: monovalent cation/H(+) antiporter subunit G [Chloroflexi bacterium]|nr:monovalent cation/H(+) antiporter subunit G [Chloroflexota bacterium]
MSEILGLAALAFGLFFSVIGVVGLIRMPDVYCRLHAAGKVSTLGLCGLLVAAAFLLPEVTLKVIALALFAVLTLPVGSHAIAAAAYRSRTPLARAVRDDLAAKVEQS